MTRHLKPIFALALFFASSARADGSGTPVSFFAMRNAGTSRSIGLSGATVAFPGDSELAFGNPASPAWQRSLLDLRYFTSSFKKSLPSFEDPVEPGKETALLASASVRPFESAALAAGYSASQTSHSLTVDPRTWRGVETDASELPVMLAARVHERIAVGGGVSFSHRSYMRAAGEEAGTSARTAKQEYQGRAWKLGVVGAVFETLSVGLSYESARAFDGGGTEGDASSAPGRYVEPWAAKFGLCYLLFPNEQSPLQVENTFFLQADFVGWESDADGALHPAAILQEPNARLVFLAPENASKGGARYITETKIVPRIGIETMWFRSKNAGVATFVGAWYEPEYVFGRDGALHTTAGAEFTLWWFVFQAAVDVARSDARTVLGAGISLR